MNAAEGTANHVLALGEDGLSGVIEERHRSGRPEQMAAKTEAAIFEAAIKRSNYAERMRRIGVFGPWLQVFALKVSSNLHFAATLLA